MNIKKPEDALNLLQELKKELSRDENRSFASELPAKEMIKMNRILNRVSDAIMLIQYDINR